MLVLWFLFIEGFPVELLIIYMLCCLVLVALVVVVGFLFAVLCFDWCV